MCRAHICIPEITFREETHYIWHRNDLGIAFQHGAKNSLFLFERFVTGVYMTKQN